MYEKGGYIMNLEGQVRVLPVDLVCLFGEMETAIGAYNVVEMIQDSKTLVSQICRRVQLEVDKLDIPQFKSSFVFHAIKPQVLGFTEILESTEEFRVKVYSTDVPDVYVLNIHLMDKEDYFSLAISLYVVNLEGVITFIVGGVEYPALWCLQTMPLHNTPKFYTEQTWFLDEVCEEMGHSGNINPSTRPGVILSRLNKSDTQSYNSMCQKVERGLYPW